jgi:hypothetical protein
MRAMNRELKKAILAAHRAEREQRIAEIHARLAARRAEHEEKLAAIHARIEARRAERDQRRTAEPAVKAEPNPELQAMKAAMMAKVPTIQFPEDDPKYNSART